MDRRRFVAVVEPFVRDMLHVALVLVGPSDAEDAVQEALLKAWNGAALLREGDTVRPWLLRITANVCRDWGRGREGRRRRETVPLSQAEEAELLTAPSVDDPGSGAAADRQDLRAMVAQLDDDLRVVIMLRYYAEMSSAEIGDTLRLPASTVRTRLQRALEQLRTLSLSGMGPAEERASR